VIDRKFQILGSETPNLIGRLNILDNILTSLNKPVPDHLQIVGARFSGKTVLLNALKSILDQNEKSPYSAVLLWDLGHTTPQSDKEFLEQFSEKLAEILEDKHPDYAVHLKESKETPYQDIAEVLQLLNKESKILVIFDGFDKPLSSSHLTRNLWDQLRELAQNSSLRLITSSRKTLRELIRNPEAQTSDFWNIFLSTPVRVDCFDEDEIAEILTKDCGLEYEKGALTELYNNTNGCAIALFEVLNYLIHQTQGEKVTNANVQEAIESSYEFVEYYIDDLWHDCSPQTQDLIRLIADRLNVQKVTPDEKLSIVEKGFARATANNLANPSRLLQRYLVSRVDEGSSLQRLFGNITTYEENFNGVIAKRISQLPVLDEELARYLLRSVEDLPKFPGACLTSIRGIIDKVFDLIWNAEFGEKKVPVELFDVWTYNRERGIDDFKANFPQGVKRLRLLNLITGTDKSDKCTKHVSRSTYVLLNSIYPFGDFGQHQEGESINLAMVYSALLLCVELVASLSRDLKN
jgi:hypothetical protein